MNRAVSLAPRETWQSPQLAASMAVRVVRPKGMHAGHTGCFARALTCLTWHRYRQQWVVTCSLLWRCRCHLGLGIPTGGKWADINTLDELRRCPVRPSFKRLPCHVSLLGAATLRYIVLSVYPSESALSLAAVALRVHAAVVFLSRHRLPLAACRSGARRTRCGW